MRAGLFTAAVLGLCITSASAQKDPELVSPQELRERAAWPMVMVEPRYPLEAAQQRIEGTVDVFVSINVDGTFDVRGMEAKPDREDFKAALREVLPKWLLSPAYGADCRPQATNGQLRFYFEIKERGPVVSVSRPKPAQAPEQANKARFRPLQRVEPEYPYGARRFGVEGTVVALMRISPEGEVEEVVIAPGAAHRIFHKPVRTALLQWRFEPRPGEPAWCASFAVNFRIKEG